MIDTKIKVFLDKIIDFGDEKSKDNVAYHCPFCNHRKKKLEIKLDKSADAFGSWHCWVCGESGTSLFSLFRKIKVSPERIQILSELLGKKRPITKKKEDIFDKSTDDIQELHFLPKEFKPLYIKTRHPEFINARKYIFDRGFSSYDILKYNIGYCDSGKYFGRIVVPSYDRDAKLNFFIARSFVDHDRPYDNPPWNRNIIGFELFINWHEPIILTEGVFDAMTIGRNSIPLFGKFMSDKLKSRIFEENVKDVIIALDTDARKEIINISEYLMNQGIQVYLLDMKDKDPNIIGRKKMIDLIYNSNQLSRNEILKIKIKERL